MQLTFPIAVLSAFFVFVTASPVVGDRSGTDIDTAIGPGWRREVTSKVVTPADIVAARKGPSTSVGSPPTVTYLQNLAHSMFFIF